MYQPANQQSKVNQTAIPIQPDEQPLKSHGSLKQASNAKMNRSNVGIFGVAHFFMVSFVKIRSS